VPNKPFGVCAPARRLDDGCIHRKALALDEACSHARRYHSLKNMAQDVAFPKAAQPIDGERRVVRNRIMRSSLQNQRWARWSFISAHGPRSERMR
jgi:hypothetical protein